MNSEYGSRYGVSYISYSGFEGQANICVYDSMILNLTHTHLTDRMVIGSRLQFEIYSSFRRIKASIERSVIDRNSKFREIQT